MHPKKEEYCQDVINLVNKSCFLFTKTKTHSLLKPLNLNYDEAYYIVKKIMNALPEHFFYNADKKILNDMLAFIGKKFILFQSQENINDEIYAYNLINFIDDLTKSINFRYYQLGQ